MFARSHRQLFDTDLSERVSKYSGIVPTPPCVGYWATYTICIYMYIYNTYIYIYMFIYNIYIYIFIYIYREREREINLKAIS